MESRRGERRQGERVKRAKLKFVSLLTKDPELIVSFPFSTLPIFASLQAVAMSPLFSFSRTTIKTSVSELLLSMGHIAASQ